MVIRVGWRVRAGRRRVEVSLVPCAVSVQFSAALHEHAAAGPTEVRGAVAAPEKPTRLSPLCTAVGTSRRAPRALRPINREPCPQFEGRRENRPGRGGAVRRC